MSDNGEIDDGQVMNSEDIEASCYGMDSNDGEQVSSDGVESSENEVAGDAEQRAEKTLYPEGRLIFYLLSSLLS